MEDKSDFRSNFISGLSGIRYYNYGEPSFKFSMFTNGGKNFYVRFYGTTNPSDPDLSSYYYYRYSYLMLPYYECPNDFPIYVLSSNKCYDSCITGKYYDPSSITCKSCSNLC